MPCCDCTNQGKHAKTASGAAVCAGFGGATGYVAGSVRDRLTR